VIESGREIAVSVSSRTVGEAAPISALGVAKNQDLSLTPWDYSGLSQHISCPPAPKN
jgi:hypothetical protein